MLHSRHRAAPAGFLTGFLLVMGVCFIPATSAMAADPALEARMSRIERMLNERSLSDLVLQIQQLQQEVQELRGQVETQQYLLRQKGIMTSSSFGTGEAAGRSGIGSAPLGDGSSSFGTADPFSARIRNPSSLSFDPALEEGLGRDTDASVNSTFVLPGQAADSGSQPGGSSNAGMLALPAPETAAGGERDLYRDAFDLLKARDYPAARTAFSEMVERYPQGQFADNGRYWLGEIGYVTQDYASAQAEFGLLVREYPLSPKVPSAMLKLGYVSYEQDELSDARSVLEEVVRRFPETTEARLAQGRLDRMQREGQ
ncbi:MAG: tol-pal system protein YbgF [Chromatiaceae bacterium]|nr:tol-pal system protein YbgF [Chromatiaceae bacterium]